MMSGPTLSHRITDIKLSEMHIFFLVLSGHQDWYML